MSDPKTPLPELTLEEFTTLVEDDDEDKTPVVTRPDPRREELLRRLRQREAYRKAKPV